MSTKGWIWFVIIFVVALIAAIGSVTIGDAQNYEYSCEYPDGSTSNDDSPDNVITVRPIVNGTPASIDVRFDAPSTIYIETVNVENVTLFYDRAVVEIFGTDLFAGMLIGDLTIVYTSEDGGYKNITLHNLPNLPSSVDISGNGTYSVLDGNSVTVTLMGEGAHTAAFEDIGGAGGDEEDGESSGSDPTWTSFWTITLLIAGAYLIIRLFKR